MGKKKRQVRVFSILTSLLMIFSLITPGFVGAQGINKVSQSLNDSNASIQSKLTDRLLTEFEDEDQVTFLVKFKEKADVMKVAKEARSKAQKANLSAYRQELAQRSSVISELKATALESQANVKDFLEAEADKGNVENIHSYYIVNGMAVTATKEIAEKIATFAEVEKILPNEERRLISTVETGVEPAENSINNIEWNVDTVNAPDAWSMGFDGAGTVVANLDSGVDLYHPALERKYRGYDEATGEFDHTYSWFDPSEGDSYPTDGHGHGSHTMGTMVGSEEDGSNQVGVAPGAKWIAAKVFDSAGGTSDQILLDAAEWMLAPGGDPDMAPDVVNNSWGGGPGIDEWYMDAVDAWRASEIVPVFSAGNTDLFNPGGPGSVAAPSNYPQSFAVGATTNTNALADYSLQGPSPYDEIKPDISAPGSGVRSAAPGGGYQGMNGTSMAAPAVSAVVALLRQANQGLTVDQIEQILMETADAEAGTDSTFPDSPNNGYGYGIVDAFAAVSSIASGLGTIEGTVTRDGEDTVAPTYEHTAPSETYSGLDLDLNVSVSDDVSITSVELHYGDTVIEANQTSGNYKSGEFAVTVPGDDLEVGTFNYTWVINDFGGNEVVSDEYSVEVKSGISTGYFEDFEENDPVGWYSIGENSAWEWGAPTSGPGEAVSGENVYATGLNGDYNSSMDATLVMPPIDMPESGDAYLQFKSWHHFEYSSTTGRVWDYGQLVISTDLEEWTVLRPFEQEKEAWNTIEVDLSDYLGERVYIGYYTSSDGSVTRPGWYIDDVALTTDSIYDSDDVPPTFEHEAPTESYAGQALSLSVEVFDNLLVGGATLHYLDGNDDWQQIEAEEVENNDAQGIFSVIVPGEEVTGETFTYKWVVRDYNGNETESSEYDVQLNQPITVGYSEDFEDGALGWTVTGDLEDDVWVLGEPTSGPNEAVSGENVFATNLGGDYPSSMREYLIMPSVLLPEGESYLEFQSWHNFEESSSGTAWDYGQVVVSTDMVEWEVLQQFQGEAESWETATVDLSEYAGQQVSIAFYAYSDGIVNRLGWYIDDVELTDTPQGEPTNMDKEEMRNAIETGPRGDEKTEPAAKVVTAEEDVNGLNAEYRPTNVPLAAQVSVLESGRSTSTDPRDGTFSLLHEAGTFTVVAESYGYHSTEEEVTLEEDGVAEVNLVLEELPKATVSGTVTNSLSGEAIENATLLLVEDANIEPVSTDAEGNFDLTAYEGDYTVKVVASDYESKEVSITLDGDMTLDVELDPFFAVGENEIGYDDGTAENARAFYDPGNGWAVKMSLPEGKDQAIVTDGVFQFHGTDWPSPGGTEFAVEVWSAGADGMPDEKLAGPVDAEAIRDLEQWTVVDLREHSIKVDGDFYMVYVQTQVNTQAPGLATDENGENAGRSYQLVGGAWSASPAEEGNYMIRANVAYGVENSEITSPIDGSITNETTITVEGTATPTTTVELYNNDVLAGTVEIDDSGSFAADVDLSEGENSLVTKTYVDGELAKIGDPVTVTLDTALPELTVTNPLEGDKFNRGTVYVEGTAADEHFASVEVNGKQVAVEDGNFSERVMLDEGENIIEVSAYDLAGNVSTEVITVTADFNSPVIENLSPSEDIHVGYGETVTVEFDSEPGLEASFSVLMPLTNTGLANANEFAMEEVSEGHYVGHYTVTNVAAAEGAVVEVKVSDAHGNESYERAEGKLFLDPEVERVNGETRYNTSIEISQTGWDSADKVILARGDEYADALSGVPLAAQLDAPILLTRSNELLDSTMAEIERLGATEVIILGGTNAVSETVEATLADANLDVNRLSGETRYETSAAIANVIAPEGTGQAVVVNGLDFPDALSVASYAASEGMPILLTRAENLPSGTKAAIAELGITDTIVVGGTQVVSNNVMKALPNAERLSGADRYATNIAVAEEFAVNNKHMYVATGKNYADALTGAVLAAKNDSGLLLVSNEVPGIVSNYVVEQQLVKLTIFGGTVAIDENIANNLLELMQ
ncbi:S8 family serine peptidase [Ornithinibacillus halophilus]|uniref:Bacillopeptidase F n=1 Tax=Ornithinibacillus halophilus TaxID=930117 RepID=A0A1M5EB27_9BACI|nr:cell wall-binding repeat-containing protein [Ornithinibacillus halophilus]SHF76463.1 bacillopeptidase F [Ornithinibacillus halophilus]